MAAPSTPEKEPTKFLDIPPEVREIIYGYALQAKDPVTIDENGKAKTIFFRQSKKKFCVIETAILRTSRQVYTEAVPFLYKNNRFFFPWADSLLLFLNQIRGSYVQYLREIEIHHFRCKQDLKRVLMRLKPARELRKFIIHATDVFDPEELAERLGPTMRRLQKTCEASRNRKNVDVSEEVFGFPACKCFKQSKDPDAEEYEGKVKELLRGDPAEDVVE